MLNREKRFESDLKSVSNRSLKTKQCTTQNSEIKKSVQLGTGEVISDYGNNAEVSVTTAVKDYD